MDSKPSMQLACLFTRHLIIPQSPLNHNIISCLAANEILWAIWMIEQLDAFEIISYLIRSLLLSAMNGIWLKQQLLSLLSLEVNLPSSMIRLSSWLQNDCIERRTIQCVLKSASTNNYFRNKCGLCRMTDCFFFCFFLIWDNIDRLLQGRKPDVILQVFGNNLGVCLMIDWPACRC